MSFKHFFPLTIMALLATVCIGCGGTRGMVPAIAVSQPTAGKALVNFHRPSNWGGGYTFQIFNDKGVLLGNVKGKSRVQAMCEPGENIFIGNGSNVSVIKAHLLADKVYDVVCDVGMGMWKASIAIHPLSKIDARRSHLAEWEANEKSLTVIRDAHTLKMEKKVQPEIPVILADFLNGDKKDRVMVLNSDDCR